MPLGGLRENYSRTGGLQPTVPSESSYSINKFVLVLTKENFVFDKYKPVY